MASAARRTAWIAALAIGLAGCGGGPGADTTADEIESRFRDKAGMTVSCTETSSEDDEVQTFTCREPESVETIIVAEVADSPGDFVYTTHDENGGVIGFASLD